MFRIVYGVLLIFLWTGNALAGNQSADAKPEKKINFNFAGYPEPGPTVMYKGRMLVGSTYERANNQEFFRQIKKAIDLSEELPRSMLRDVNLIRVIIYAPPGSSSKPAITTSNNADITSMYTGAYIFGPDFKQPAPMIVYRDVMWLAPITLGYALVASSLYARLHRNSLILAKRINKLDRSSPEFVRLRKN